MNKMAREDFQYIRNKCSEDGMEITPSELLDLFRDCCGSMEIVEEPGLVTLMRELKDGEEWKDL